MPGERRRLECKGFQSFALQTLHACVVTVGYFDALALQVTTADP
jgi:hypothetical protein